MHDNGNRKKCVRLSVTLCVKLRTAGLDVYEEICMLETLWGFCKQQHALWVIDFILLQQGQPCTYTAILCGDVQNVLYVHTVCFVLTHCMHILLFFTNYYCVWHRDYERIRIYSTMQSVCHAYKEPGSNYILQFTFNQIFHSIG